MTTHTHKTSDHSLAYKMRQDVEEAILFGLVFALIVFLIYMGI